MRNSSESGLTLIEIMMVLVILGIVIAFVGSRLFAAGDSAKAELTKSKLQTIKQYIDQYRLRYDALPPDLNSLVRCTEATGPGCIPITGEESLADAWRKPLIYSIQDGGRQYVLKSLGADMKEGGEGVNFDHFVKGP